MARSIQLKGPTVVEWSPAPLPCGRCGRSHAREWYTLIESEGFVGDPCLTPDERARWCRPEEKPLGKIETPKKWEATGGERVP